MSIVLLIFLGISLTGSLAMIIRFYLKQKNMTQLIISLVLLGAAILMLYFLFFSRSATEPKGDGGNDIYVVIILYGCMFLGMLAEQGYSHFSQPRSKRRKGKKFDIGPLLVPVFTSPIIFIPLFAALQNEELDILKITAPRLMVFLVAFENGFFRKGYLEKRREEFTGKKEKGNEVFDTP